MITCKIFLSRKENLSDFPCKVFLSGKENLSVLPCKVSYKVFLSRKDNLIDFPCKIFLSRKENLSDFAVLQRIICEVFAFQGEMCEGFCCSEAFAAINCFFVHLSGFIQRRDGVFVFVSLQLVCFWSHIFESQFVRLIRNMWISVFF